AALLYLAPKPLEAQRRQSTEQDTSADSSTRATTSALALSFFTTETRGSHCRHNRLIGAVVNYGPSHPEGIQLVPQEQDKDVEEQPSGRHARKEGTGVDPLIDLNRDPTPGVADHARPDHDD
ncbi:MAG TPA: hypothetical protein VHZ97_29825, partial [Pseudonocardiaceae bacterium]|nr:hypothetical protein [Pseudonocardiaceae bacterium]